MRYLRIILLFIVLLLVGGAVLAYFSLQPRVVSIFPADGATDQHGTTAVQVTFSTGIRPTNIEKYLTFEPNTTGVYQVIDKTLIFTPSVPWREDEKVTVKLLPGVKSTLGIPLSRGVEWRFTTRHPWLLFLLEENDGSHLYSVDPQGLEVTRLLEDRDSVLDYNPASSSTIYYSAITTEGSIIRRYDLETGSVTDIVNCSSVICSQVRVSPDGGLLIYQRSGKGETTALWQQNLVAGMASGSPALVGMDGHITRDPAWSSTSWLAYYDETGSAFQFYHPASHKRVSFENTTGEPGSWNAGGDIYTVPDLTYTDGNGIAPAYFSQLISYAPDTEERSELTRDNRMEDLLPAYSPDGRQLVFARRFLNPQNWTPGRQIWLMNVDGANIHPLTNSSVNNHLGFAWSPDGALLAYMRFNTASFTGERQLWIMDMTSGATWRILMNAHNLQWLP
ncbi:MAG: hypothetical protein C0391_09610 [Anaerolinea sp.]|nr:hypothetical protein [Anaerolinea sp.]